jgi:hypothetical protein
MGVSGRNAATVVLDLKRATCSAGVSTEALRTRIGPSLLVREVPISFEAGWREGSFFRVVDGVVGDTRRNGAVAHGHSTWSRPPPHRPAESRCR